MGLGNISVGKCPLCQACQQPEFNPQKPHGRRKELTSACCSLTTICMPWHISVHTFQVINVCAMACIYTQPTYSLNKWINVLAMANMFTHILFPLNKYNCFFNYLRYFRIETFLLKRRAHDVHARKDSPNVTALQNGSYSILVGGIYSLFL